MIESSKRWSGVRLFALAFGITPIRATVPLYQRTVYAACGPVSRAVPLVLHYRGKRRRALRLAERLRSYGYQVSLRRERRERERERVGHAKTVRQGWIQRPQPVQDGEAAA